MAKPSALSQAIARLEADISDGEQRLKYQREVLATLRQQGTPPAPKRTRKPRAAASEDGNK